MPNIAGVLKDEIRRLAKKEIKAQVGKPRRAAVRYRRDITKLKRLLGQQEREIKCLKKKVQQQGRPQPTEDQLEGVRFSARSVKAQRQRLGLSVADYGTLAQEHATHYHANQHGLSGSGCCQELPNS